VPEGLYVESNEMFRSLKSTNDLKGRPRCNSLEGEIGTSVACKIYDLRPTPCRDFRYSYEDGGPKDLRCDEARSRFGLLPLVEKLF
jgi:Fe-S-cluster containining protein